MKEKTENILWINIFCLLGFIAVILPVLLLGHFDYPFADDWSLAGLTHGVLEDGGNIVDFFKVIGESVIVWRGKGEPRYASVFFASLQPGIWGEHYYRITPWLMIEGLCISESILCMNLLKSFSNKNKRWSFPIIVLSLMIQILCVPYPDETFYWYMGAVNYTFIFSLSLILLTIFLTLKNGNTSKKRTIFLTVTGSLLAVLVGGNNYGTSLSSACLFTALSLWVLVHNNRKGFFRTLPITLITICGLLICATAPGNQIRINDEFGGETSGVFYSIVMSLRHTALIFIS